MTGQDAPKVDPAFRRLYPELSEEELARARANFDRFIELVVKIAKRELAQGKKTLPEDPEPLRPF